MDAFRAATFTCRPAGGQCDVAEMCTGASGTCPADIVVPAGIVCGSLTVEQCDVVDVCNGTDKSCPDLKAPPGTPCNDNDVCTYGDTCDGRGTCDAGSGDACAAGKVTGGGQVVPTIGDKASFGFVAQRQTLQGPTTGHCNYVNHTTGLHVNGPVTLLVLFGSNSAMFQGNGLCNGTLCAFEVKVTDNGEPGRNNDTIQVTMWQTPMVPPPPPPPVPFEEVPERRIKDGNIQVHK